MALIPLIPISLLGGKLVAHIYEDTPAWLLAMSGQVFTAHKEQTRLHATAAIAATAVQMWSGEFADQMSPWSRPTRTSDVESIDLEAKIQLIQSLPYRVLESIVAAFHAASHLDDEKKSVSNAASESTAPANLPNQE